VVPSIYIPKVGQRIMGLTDPTKKMSKSDDGTDKNYISLFDTPAAARNKIKSAITDSESVVRFDTVNKPGISNLLTIYSSLTDISIKDLEKKYANSNYGPFKADLGEVVFNFLTELQQKYQQIFDSPSLDAALQSGAEQAHQIAKNKIRKLYHKLGLD
jgi:tryptophanyl-tRNA synthetase